MATTPYRIGYLILHGYGYVTRRITTTTVTAVTQVDGDIYDVEVTWAGYYSTLNIEDEIGSRMICENWEAARNVDDGEYTLVDVTSGGTRIVLRGSFPDGAPTTGNTGTGTTRIEDFYKFTNAPPPNFVTGDNAKSRWIQCIPEDGLNPTVQQQVDLFKAGFSNLSGITINMAYLESNSAQTRLVKFVKGLIYDDADKVVRLDYLNADAYGANGNNTNLVYPRWNDTSIQISNIDPIPDNFVGNDAADWGYAPVWLDREAILIDSQTIPGSPTYSTLTVIRGLLRTLPRQHAPGVALIEYLPGLMGTTCQLLSINSDDYYLASEEELYYGLVESVRIGKSQTEIYIEVADATVGAFAKQINASFSDEIVNQPTCEWIDIPVHNMSILSDNPFIGQNSETSWQWIKIGKMTFKLRDWTYEDNNGDYPSWAKAIQRTETGKYLVSYRLKPWFAYLDVYSAGTPQFINLDTGYIVEPSEDTNDQNQYIDVLTLASLGYRYRDNRIDKTYVVQADGLETGINTSFGNNDPTDVQPYPLLYFFNAEDPTSLSVDSSAYSDTINNFIGDESQLAARQEAELCHLFSQPSEVNGVSITFAQSYYNGSNNQFNPFQGFKLNKQRISVATILLQILTSGDGLCGNSPNGPFDVLPYGMGLDIPLERIDLNSFGFIEVSDTEIAFSPTAIQCAEKGADRWSDLILNNVHISKKDSGNIAKWLTDNILKQFGIGIGATRINGTWKIAAFPLHGIVPDNNLVKNSIAASIDDNDLYFDLNRDIDFQSEIISKNIIESIELSWQNYTSKISEGASTYNQSFKAIAIAPGDDIGSILPKIYSGVQSAPISDKFKFCPWSPLPGLAIGKVGAILNDRVKDFSQVLLNLEFWITLDTPVNIGQKVLLDFDKVINQFTGERGLNTVIGLVVGQKIDFSSRLQNIKVIALRSDVPLDTWAPTAEIDSGATTNITCVDQSKYANVNLYTKDYEAFEAGQEVLLYSTNWELLSIDGSGDPDPRTIISVTGADIKLSSAFTDSGGSNISITSGMYLVLANKGDQLVSQQAIWSWINDGISYWR